MSNLKMTSPPLQPWMLALEPRYYARSWFDDNRLAKTIADAFSGIKQKKPALLQKALTARAKETLSHAEELLKQRFLEDSDGVLYLGGRALIMDEIIKIIFDKVTQTLPHEQDSPTLSLMATGGYGRGELSPKSDIDLLFLTNIQADKSISAMIEMMLYILWDLGQTVGHATRSLRQQIKAVQDDITIRTAFLEARPLAGDHAQAEQILAKFKKEIIKGSAVAFLNAKLEEREMRLKRNGSQRYVVEPNIKDGKGGLRDLHTLFWIARYAYQAESMLDLIDRGLLTKSELQEFSSAQRFLWSVRTHLHLRAGREDDRLTFDAQMDIAPRLGFHNRKGMKGVERFMRRYHLAAKTVGSMTRIFWAAIAADFETEPRTLSGAIIEKLLPSRAPKPFVVEAGRLNLPTAFKLRHDLNVIIDMFVVAQNKGIDIHPKLLRRLHRNLKLIDAEFRQNPQFNARFLDILTSRDTPERVLRMMNESGFLGKFLPDFGRIVAMMQFDMYHSYTVDEHTLFALGILHGIETGQLSEIAPVATVAIKEVTLRKELYVALLLHDIAKGRGGDHSILGAEIARKVCPRFGMTDEETETVAWLVRHHLLMSNTAFRYDLNDPTTIEQFAAAVQSPERLNLLLTLTVADIRAVGPNVWNGWKAQLMRDLYARTMTVLRGEAADHALLQLAAKASDHLQDYLAPTWTDDEIRHHLNIFYPSYWTSFDEDSYARHADLCRKHEESSEVLTVGITPDRKKNATELVIITADDAGLFSRITGGVAAMGAYIVDARITTRKDGLTLDVLWIQDQDRQAITEKADLDKLRSGLKDALTGVLDLDAATDRRHRQTPSRIRRMSAPARVILNNNASNTHTVIEINGKDAPGLLFKLTQKMAELGLQIQTASVSTYGDRVVDVFYVKDGFGLKITSQTRIDRLQKELLMVLEESDPANKVAA